jgi:hypothetical protein
MQCRYNVFTHVANLVNRNVEAGSRKLDSETWKRGKWPRGIGILTT